MTENQLFWVKEVINRLPSDLVPENQSWQSVLRVLTQLKTERNNLIESNRLRSMDTAKEFMRRFSKPYCVTYNQVDDRFTPENTWATREAFTYQAQYESFKAGTEYIRTINEVSE